MQPKLHNPHTLHRAGFTLVELMIAIAISAILLLGVVQVFVINRHSFKLNNGLADAQDNARFAVHTMSEDIRMAGYIGCRATNVANILKNNTDPFLDFNTPLQGWEGGVSTFPTQFASYVVPNTDAIVVLRGGDFQYQMTKVPSNNDATFTLNTTKGLSQYDVVMVSDCSQGSVFQITNPIASNQITHTFGNVAQGPGNCTNLLGSPEPTSCSAQAGTPYYYGMNAGVLKMKATAYFIGTSVSGKGNSLFSMSLNQGVTAKPQELAEGVENMQILYGVDTSGDGLANQYITADKVAATTGGFKSVVSVRLALLVDTTTDPLKTATTKKITLLGNTYTYTNKKLYLPITTTIKLRNRGVM